MRRLWFNIVTFVHYIFFGLRSADNLLATSNKESDGTEGEGVHWREEKSSVYDDLLKGVVTQEVKELRHEMYYAERKSHDYEYKGNGIVKKRNKIFEYDGKVENEDNRKILIVQENKEDPSTLFDFGILSDNKIDYKRMGDPSLKNQRNFTISIERDFLPAMRLEEYATKVVVKEGDGEDSVILDVYVSQYHKQFDRRSRIFLNEIERIYMGDKRSEVIDFNKLGFVTSNAYGAKDLIVMVFDNVKFDTILKFDGSYVLRFNANSSLKHDIVEEFYEEEADRKSKEHEARKDKETTITLTDAYPQNEMYDCNDEEVDKIIQEFNDAQK